MTRQPSPLANLRSALDAHQAACLSPGTLADVGKTRTALVEALVAAFGEQRRGEVLRAFGAEPTKVRTE